VNPHDPLSQPGSPQDRYVESRDGLILRLTFDGQGEIFERFFSAFDRAFVLPNEKENIDGLRACLGLNHGAAYELLSARYGPYREICLIAEDGGVEIGGANFIAMPVAGDIVTANLNYIFINSGVRRRGYLRRLFAATRDVVDNLFAVSRPARSLIFIEQNDPYRMSGEDYRRDTEFTGLDQFDRLRIWSGLGAKIVDFPYQQPPLSAEQDIDETLLYSVLGAEGALLDSCVLEAHLRRFFGVSVLKGGELRSNPVAHKQVEALRAACTEGRPIALLDPSPLLAEIPSREERSRYWAEPPKAFVDAVKLFASGGDARWR